MMVLEVDPSKKGQKVGFAPDTKFSGDNTKNTVNINVTSDKGGI